MICFHLVINKVLIIIFLIFLPFQVMNDTVIGNLGLVAYARQREHTNKVISGHLTNLTVTRRQSVLGLVTAIYGDYRIVMQTVQVRYIFFANQESIDCVFLWSMIQCIYDTLYHATVRLLQCHLNAAI